MKKPHKHAELIKAWADGAIIQAKSGGGGWYDLKIELENAFEYRIKPEPRPDFYGFMKIDTWKLFQVVASSSWMEITRDQEPQHNLKITFDGETGKPKSAEVLK